MLKLIKTEILKLKRYSIVWVALAAMVCGPLLSWFTVSMDTSGVYNFSDFSDNVIWTNFDAVNPLVFTLLAGYIIAREWTDDTLKNILTIPVPFNRLLTAKLLVVAALAAISGIGSFLATVLFAQISGLEGFTAGLAVQSLAQMVVMNLCVYIAVLPIIVFTSKRPGSFVAGVGFAFFYGVCGGLVAGHGLGNIYPLTAGFAFIQYRIAPGAFSSDFTYNLPLCCMVLALTLLLSIVMVLRTDKHVRKYTLAKRTAAAPAGGKNKR
ncbi:ABC transporter permease [Eubacterium sp. 1001713B170207_170306_E7]|uniref:ABC transporter permease n=1 Tax=Eubacterium sp. 1001713B170207_170306_E7 TaxID=2787097 RepID=UPI00189971A7|nr:ABC transporter permease [Eubacterium sp. 1001713B170207_170306_E7]